MISTNWQKQNRAITYKGIAVTALVIILTTMMFSTLGLINHWLRPIVTISVLLIGLYLTFSLKQQFANEKIRVLRVDFEKIERDFRLLFKQNHIRYYRRSEDDAFSYEFPGKGVTLTIQPYVLHDSIFHRRMTKQPATEVVLKELTIKSLPFIQTLEEAIDEMSTTNHLIWDEEEADIRSMQVIVRNMVDTYHRTK